MKMRVAEATGQSFGSALLLVERGSIDVAGGFAWRSDARVRWGDTLRLPTTQLDTILERFAGRILVIAATDGATWDREGTANRSARCTNLRIVESPGNHHLHMDAHTARPVADLIAAFVAGTST